MVSHPNPLQLADHVSALFVWLREHHQVPAFDEIVVLDTSDASVRYAAGWLVPGSALRSVPEFSERFDRYLRAGYSWVNLSAYGLLGTRMVLGIELPRASVGARAGATSVNYSGPAMDASTGAPVWSAPVTVESASP